MMNKNTHFTVALHSLTWMALRTQNHKSMTSDQIASSVNTNPVFIRRILGMLQKAQLVTAQRGSGAGWNLARQPEEITLLDVYNAVQPEPPFALHYSMPNQACVIGSGIQPALTQVYADAEAAFKQQFADRTIADLLRETLANKQPEMS